MILEFYNGQIHLDAQVLSLESDSYLVPENNHRYKLKNNLGGESEDKQYIYINSNQPEVMINTSWYGEYPLFYYMGKQYSVISSSFESLLFGLKKKYGGELELDRTAVFESMIFNNPLRTRTFFKDIKKITAGKKITINFENPEISSQTVFVLPFDKGAENVDNKKILDHAVEILSALINEDTFQDGKVLLPLSGGLDSRLLACLLKQKNIPYDAITFGPEESTEPYIAKKVAKQLDIPIRHLILKDEYYKKYGDELTWLTGGLSNHAHCHLYSCISDNRISCNYIVHGYLGGEFAGAAQPDTALSYGMSKDEAFEIFIKKHISNFWIWNQLSGSDRDEIIKDLCEIMDENCRDNLPCHFDEYVHNVDRQFALIANIFSPVEKFGKVIRPFACREYAEFFNSLPFQYRSGRKLFKDACRLMFPAEFSIGTQNQIFNADSISGKIENKVSSLFSKLSYASFLLTKGKLVIRNPKAYERHRELLCTTLNKDFLEAISDVSDLFQKDLSHLAKISLSNRLELNSQYGILSLSILLKQLDANKIKFYVK